MTYKGVIELQAKENAALRARVAELEQELELTRVERTLERQHHVEAVTRFNSVSARLDALTAENKELREAAQEAIQAVIDTVSLQLPHNVWLLCMIVLNKAKGSSLPPPPEEK